MAGTRAMHRAGLTSVTMAMATVMSTPQGAWQEGGTQEPRANASPLPGPRCLAQPGGQGSWAEIQWTGARVLTLHPVPAHRAEEVGVEAEGLVNFPKDLSDVPDLPRDGHQAHLYFLQEASQLPAH